MDSGMTLNARLRYCKFSNCSRSLLKVKMAKVTYKLQKYLRSNQQTCINHRPVVWVKTLNQDKFSQMDPQ
jgi:DNA-directed RNA polymerase beta subunit